MKNNILTICVVGCFMTTLLTLKYLNLRDAYHKAEKERVEYCKKYKELKVKLQNEKHKQTLSL